MIKNQKINKEKYLAWLSKQVSKDNFSKYCTVHIYIDKICKQNFIYNKTLLYISDIDEVEAIKKKIVDRKNIRIKYSSKLINDMCLVLSTYCNYLEYYFKKNTDKNKKNIENLEPENIIELEKYKNIIKTNYTKGYKLDSEIELEKFKQTWKKTYKVSNNLNDIELKNSIKKVGLLYDGRIYHIENVLSSDIRDKILKYIENLFEENKNIIYYEALYDEFENDFIYENIYSCKMLKSYLEYINDNYYIAKSDYITNNENVIDNYTDKISEYFIEQYTPLNLDYVYDEFSYLSVDKINEIIETDDKYIKNSNKEYFHIDIIYIEQKDIEYIENLINSYISQQQFIGINELMKFIKEKSPNILENNINLSDVGFKGYLKYIFEDKFNFNGAIINSLGKNISVKDVFENFVKSNETFTIEQLKVLKDELKTNIHFEVVYQNSIRIDKHNFISKHMINFDVAEIDNAIYRICGDSYKTIRQVYNDGVFPEVEFPWTEYLLESYVNSYSEKYKLINPMFTETSCVGAIVHKSISIDDFDTLIIDALVNSDIELNKDNVLEYLVIEGYKVKKIHSNIEELIEKIKKSRNKEGK